MWIYTRFSRQDFQVRSCRGGEPAPRGPNATHWNIQYDPHRNFVNQVSRTQHRVNTKHHAKQIFGQ